MISVDEFRAALGSDAPESDADVAALRDLVAGMAKALLDSLEREAAGGRGIDNVSGLGGDA